MGGRFWRQSLLIAKKDLSIFVRDRMALVWAVIFPLFMILLFNMVFANFAGSGAQELVLTLASEEAPGGVSHQIIGELARAGGPAVRSVEPGEARDAVKRGQLGGFLLFPEDFGRRLMAGEPARLVVVADPQAMNDRAALSGVARVIASEATAGRVLYEAVAEAMRAAGGGAPGAPSTGGVAGGEPLIAFEYETVGPPATSNPANWTVPGYLTMFVFFAAAMGTSEIARERSNYTLDRLRALAATGGVLIWGKFFGLAVRGLVQVLILWVVGVFAFGADFGAAPGALLVVTVLMVLASAAAGIFLATFARTEGAATGLGVLVSLVAAPLGGCWWPSFIMPRLMQTAGRITPHFWCTEAMSKLMLYGARPIDVWPNMAVLAGFALFFMAVAAWRLRGAEG